jgi:pilus assembly protein CpaC
MKINNCSVYTISTQLYVKIIVICLGVVVSTNTMAQTTLPASKNVGSNIQIISEQPSTSSPRTTKERRVTMPIDPRTGVVNRPTLPIALYAGQVLVIEQVGVERVAIGNGGLLSATVVSDKQIVLLGESAGTTTLYVWLRNGTQINYEVTVSTDNASKTAAELRKLLSSDPGIRVEAVGDRLVIDGSYANQESADKIQKIVKAYPQVLNLVRDRPDERSVLPEPMIQLDVKVVEVRKQALDEIGIKWSNLGISGPTFATSGYLYADTANFRGTDSLRAPITSPARPFISYLGLATQITSALNFLESNGDSWLLAEPRISTVSGGSSKVQIGGEIPIPVAAGFGAISIIYKQYGVILEFKPVIDKSGNLRSTILAEVSAPDRVNGNGQFVAFTNNKTETEVSLKQNETLVISGLLRNVGARNREGLPGIGNVPVIGRLFSNHGTSNEQLETLVVVTPRLHKASADSSEVLNNQNAYNRLNAVKSAVEEKLVR